MWVLAHPKTGEREVVAPMLDRDHHLIRAGQLILADKGFAGAEFAAFVVGHGGRLVRPDRRETNQPSTVTSAVSGNGSSRSTTP